MNSWPILFHQNPHPLCSVVPASTPTSFESNLRHFWDGEFFSRTANLFWMVIWKQSLQLGDLHFLRLWSPYGNVSLLRMGFGCTIPVKFHLFLVECEVLLFKVADRRKSREVWGLQERLTGQVLPLSLRKSARVWLSTVSLGRLLLPHIVLFYHWRFQTMENMSWVQTTFSVKTTIS